MATQLPARIQQRTPAQPARSPNEQDVNKVPLAQDPGVNVPNVGAPIAQGVQDVATAMSARDQRLQAAQNRINAKRDNLNSILAIDEFKNQEQTLQDSLIADNLLNSPDYIDRYTQGVNDIQSDIEERAGFTSAEAQLQFKADLLTARFEVGDTRAIDHMEALNVRQMEVAGKFLDAFSQDPQRAGESFGVSVSGARDMIQSMFGQNLPEEMENALLNDFVLEQYQPRFSLLIASGNLEDARLLLNHPAVQDALTPEKVRADQARLTAVEAKLIEASILRNQKIADGAAALNKPVDQLDASEIRAILSGEKTPEQLGLDARATVFAALGREGTPAEIMSVLNKGRGSQINNIMGDRESKRDEELGKGDADILNAMRIDGRRQANDDLAAIGVGSAALDATGQAAFEPGALADLRISVGKVLTLFDVKSEAIERWLGSATTGDLLVKSLASLIITQAEGMKRVTNMKLRFIRDSVGTISSTREGLKMVFEIAENQAEQNLALADLASEWAAKPSGQNALTPEFWARVKEIREVSHPALPDELRDRILGLEKDIKKKRKKDGPDAEPSQLPMPNGHTLLQQKGTTYKTKGPDGKMYLWEEEELKSLFRAKQPTEAPAPPKTEAGAESQETPAAPAKEATQLDTEFGIREDGTPKGTGFLGLIPLPDGRVASELSITFEVDGEEILAPALIPGLSQEELDFLIGGGKPADMSDELFKKIQNHALKRIDEGRSPFIEPGEEVSAATEQPAEVETTPERVDFVKQQNTFEPRAQDRGKGQLEIGFGITGEIFKKMTGEKLRKNQEITEEAATKMLETFITTEVDPEIAEIDKVNPLSTNQVTAVTSLIMDVGIDRWKRSKARKALIAGDTATFIKEAFDPTIGFKSKDPNRRNDQKELFLNG